ncbi:MAG TPA: methyltransferase, partial [Nonomuraea sp.]|nr:methyltransferase [Nonomuraea sp.]
MTTYPLDDAPAEHDAVPDREPDPAALPRRDRSRAYYDPTAVELGISPFNFVQFMIDAGPNAAALHAAVRLGVTEALAGKEMTSDEVAHACQADPDAMRRLLRWLHAFQFVTTRQDRYQLTGLGRVLTTQATPSQRHAVLVTGSPYWQAAIGDLAETIRRGHPAPPDGLSPYEYLAHHRQLGDEFDQFMTARSAAVGQDLADVDDFARVRIVADLGGGRGGVLAALLRAHPHLIGVLADRDDVIARAKAYLTGQSLADRVRLAPGNLFDGVPAGAQRYLLSSVLHNYTDRDCIDLLAKVRDAMNSAGDEAAELWIVEGMLPDEAGVPSRWYSTDMRMLSL